MTVNKISRDVKGQTICFVPRWTWLLNMIVVAIAIVVAFMEVD